MPLEGLNASSTGSQIGSVLIRPTGIPQQFRCLLYSGDALYQSDLAKPDGHWRREELHFHEPLNARRSRQFPGIHYAGDVAAPRRIYRLEEQGGP